MGGSGQRGGSSSVTTQPGPPQIPPAFNDYFNNVGAQANLNLGRYNLGDYAGANPLNVPGMNDFQREAMGQIWARGTQGIPQPKAESQLQNNVMPWMMDVARTPVGVQPQENQAMDFAKQLPGMAAQANTPNAPSYYNLNGVGGAPTFSAQQFSPMGTSYQSQKAPDTSVEGEGINTLRQLASGQYGDSPAYRAAKAQIEQYVNPATMNQMAKMGLGRSGAAVSQLQQQADANMLPLAQQALTLQQQAGTELGNIGNRQSERYNDMYNRNLTNAGLENQANIAAQGNNASMANTALSANAGLAGQFAGLNNTAQIAAINANAGMQNQYLQNQFSGQENASNRGLQAALQGTLPTYMQIGNNAANRQTDWINRQLNTGQNMYSPLLQLGQNENTRNNQSITDLLNAGALDRDIAGQISQSSYNDLMRRQALAETFGTGMLGQLPSFSSIPQTTTETTKTAGGK